MKKIQKNTSYVYYHGKAIVSHSVIIIMDGIFDRENFRNAIVWWHHTAGISKTNFQENMILY